MRKVEKGGELMKQEERLDYLVRELVKEEEEFQEVDIPEEYQEKRRLLRSLMNIRMPRRISRKFLKIQDEFLKQEAQEKGIVEVEGLPSARQRRPATKVKNADKIVLWQGDITRLSCDAIINAANSRLLGCFIPNHECIDNAIHSAAGLQLREECARIMDAQPKEEPVGSAKLTNAYNLPCDYVIHTVGPVVQGEVTQEQKAELRSCYQSCLELAEEWKLSTIAFCCISTGEYHFPNELAAEIALDTISRFLDIAKYVKKVVINVYKEEDYRIYDRLFR